MPTRITPPSSPATNSSSSLLDYAQIRASDKAHTPSKPLADDSNVNNATANLPHFDPPKAEKISTAVANYQSRWEREKAKARAEGTDIDGGDPKMIGPWVIGEMLGRGASGRVRLARHFSTGKLAAVKILSLHPNLSSRASALATAGEKAEKMMLTAEREIAVMKLLDHPNIMKMYDVWSSPKELYLVLEYVKGGELFDYLCSRGSRLPLLEAVSIIKQVLAGVNYCHRFNICHRDLKPENILLVNETIPIPGSTKTAQIKHVKIADFGMSTLDSLNGLLRTSCGSPHYASPEIVRGQTYSGAASDIWSCGVILFALLTSRLPFDDPNVNNVLRKVRDGRFTIPEWVLPEAKDLLMRMLEVDFNKRISMRDIIAHPLMRMDTPGIILPPAPRLDELALPVAREEVDPDLLRNLCIIWREKDRSVMAARLCSDEKNFEKAFYFLLCRYRDRSFEEYNMDVSLSQPDSANSSPAFQLPPILDGHPDCISRPIRRHYPGRANPQILASLKKAAQSQSARHGDGSPVRNKHRDLGRKASINSPRRSRIPSDASTTSNSPRKGSIPSSNQRKSGAPRSRACTLRGSKDEGKDTGSRSRSSTASRGNGVVGPASTRRVPASPVKRTTTISTEAKTSPKRVSSVTLPKHTSPQKTSQSNVVSPKKSTTGSLSKVSTSSIAHRRAASASTVVSTQRPNVGGATPEGIQTPGRIPGFKASSIPIGRIQSAIPEAKMVDGPIAPPRSPILIPAGIVQQRASLLTSKLVSMAAETQITDGESMHAAPIKAKPLKATAPPNTLSGSPMGPFHPSHKGSTHINRLPSGGVTTPTRPLARMMMAPTIFSSASAGIKRGSMDQAALAAPSHHRRSVESERAFTHVPYPSESNATPKPDGGAQSPALPSPQFSQPVHSPHVMRTPGKSGRLMFVFETPSKSSGKGFLGSPNRMRGLGLFVSPGKSKIRSPSKSPTLGTAMEDDVTPKPSIINHSSHAGSKLPPTEFGVVKRGIGRDDSPVKAIHRGRHGNAGAISAKSRNPAIGNGLPSVPMDASSSLEPRFSGSSTNLSGSGRSSGSSADVWEKVEWSADASASVEGMPVRNEHKLKKKPAPLDLLNPYHRGRSQATNPNQLPTPVDIQRQSQSPLLSPFVGLAGFSWGGASSTPPTPSLVASSGMESGPSTGSSQVVVSSSGAGRGLFAKLFDWKSPNLHLLSTESPVATREECARLLRCLNVTFVPSETGGFNCRADDVTDHNGHHIPKVVRFRMEIECISRTPNLMRSMSFVSGGEHSSTSGSHSQWNTSLEMASSPKPTPFLGYDIRRVPKPDVNVPFAGAAEIHGTPVVCTVTLVQEKGAYSMLKIIHQRMQGSWRFDGCRALDVNTAPLHHPVSGKAFDSSV